MFLKYVLFVVILTTLFNCGKEETRATDDKNKIRAEIDKILEIQESAYHEHSESGRRRLAETCDDSLTFVGGDDGGVAHSSNFYVNDLADGYSKMPYDKTYGIYENTVVVTAIQQTFKVFNLDTIYFNSRYTKIFARKGESWKMIYVTYAPLPVIYNRVRSVSPKSFEDYAGLYRVDSLQVDTVTVANGRVFLGTASGKSELFPLNDSTFFGHGYFGRTVFVKNNDGAVTHSCYEYPDGQRIVFKRINDDHDRK